MNIAVAGTGYVGMSIATLLAQHNHVTAVEEFLLFFSISTICSILIRFAGFLRRAKRVELGYSPLGDLLTL